MDVNDVKTIAHNIRNEMHKAIIGQSDTIDLMLVSLFARGHILLEGPPGTAKTFMAQCFAKATKLDFGRIQFTPDLMPGDLLGTNLFDFQTNAFSLVKGPVFCDVLLADEINRTPPKTQAALLEAMQERKVTIDSKTYKLGEAFMVVATQNPIEQQGTYPLPEAQLDRFMFKHILSYPNLEDEMKIVAMHGATSASMAVAKHNIKPVVSKTQLAEAVSAVETVKLSDEVIAYVVNLVRATRENPLFENGASPRAAAKIANAARAIAALEGRDYVIPDDVKAIALPALRHRVILSPIAEIEGRNTDELVSDIIEQTETPR